MNTKKKIVVKVGTSALTQGSKKLSSKYMLELARQIVYLHEQDHHVILVTSGAIAAGKELMHHPSLDPSVPSKQMFSAIGQVQLMQRWTQIFALYEMHVGQLLLTKDDLSNHKRYLNARNTLTSLLHHKVLPIINENDSVATKEIRVGDNDNLAALVANLIGADLLILLTDQQGFYTADPRLHSEAELIPVVKHIDDHMFSLAKESSSSLGTGGMTTKLEAAQKASECGTLTVIASSAIPNVLIDICEGKQIGTSFLPKMTPQESRKRWILSEKCQGLIHVDEDAAASIVHHGASLLPSGVIQTTDSFQRGAIIHIVGPSKQTLAAGITNYGNEEIQKLIGIQLAKIEDVLGYSYGPEIVHRSNMTQMSKETLK